MPYAEAKSFLGKPGISDLAGSIANSLLHASVRSYIKANNAIYNLGRQEDQFLSLLPGKKSL
jgi:hypothetical protein